MRKKYRQRKAAAIVELAICLPVLVLIVFGSIEIAGSIFMKQTLTSAAHEGALTGMRLNAQETEIITRVNQILTARGVTGCTTQVVTDGPAFADLNPGDMFRVEIQNPSANTFINLTSVSVSVASQRQ
jgi:Flp pilus assembly protein TadG